jgi:hypothetical protein
MTGLIRKAVFLALGSGFVASAAMAGVPGWLNSIQPSFIKVGGTVGGLGDPLTATSYTIRDPNSTPVFNAKVKLDFSGCTDIYVCASQDVGLTVVGSTIEGATDISGVITFRVRGGSTGSAGVFHSAPCMTVTLPDNPPAGAGNALRVAAFDLTGGGGVDASDLSQWGTDFNICQAGTLRARSDYTGSGGICPGAVDASDLSLWGSDFNQPGVASCSP